VPQLINFDYEFYVNMKRDMFNQYIVTMLEINPNPETPFTPIPFIFDTGAAYTMLNKNLAEFNGWHIFQTGLELGSYVKDVKLIICDLRKIPNLAFGVRQIFDLVVATPTDANIIVSNLLERSFINNFYFGINQDVSKIYFKERNIAVDPNFSFSRVAYMS
jgi:hypothetical protein